MTDGKAANATLRDIWKPEYAGMSMNDINAKRSQDVSIPMCDCEAFHAEMDRLRHKCGEDRPGLSELADAWLAPNADEAVAALHNKYPGYEDLAFNYASDFATELMSRRYLTTELT